MPQPRPPPYMGGFPQPMPPTRVPMPMPPTRVPMPAIRPGGRPGGYSGPPRLPDPSQLRDRSYEDIGRLVGTLGGSGRGEFPLGTAGPRVDPSDPNYIPESPREDLFNPFEVSDQDMTNIMKQTGRGTADGLEFRGGQMGGPMDNMGLMRRKQDRLRLMQNQLRGAPRPSIARLQQQQQGDRSMPRAITGREQLMRRRSPVYQGPTLQNSRI